MGLSRQLIRYLIREHLHAPFDGPVLTLGRQSVQVTLGELHALFEEEGVTPHPLDGVAIESPLRGARVNSTVPLISDRALFKALAGLDVTALDVSSYQDAEVVHDLNEPIPGSLRGRFGLVLDGGTSEHVFDVRQVLRNVADATRPGGRVVHITPATSYMEHGYYQFSASVYLDWYWVNGFTDLRCFVTEVPWWDVYYLAPWEFWEWDPARPFVALTSPNPMLICFSAVKAATSTSHRVPQQGAYLNAVRGHGRPGVRAPAWRAPRIPRDFPASVVAAIRRLVGRDRRSRPWGLRSVGRY